MQLTKKDHIVLRELGQMYMERASLDIHKKKRDMWKALNKCEMVRPMVVIDQLPWNEFEQVECLTCQVEHEFWRNMERSLRRTIYMWDNFPVDMVLEPFFVIQPEIRSTGYGLGIKETILESNKGEPASSHRYTNQIRTMEDIEKIKPVEIIVDQKENQSRLEQGKIIFEGIAPVILGHGIQLGLPVWDVLSQLMGVEDIYYDLIDRPEFIKCAIEKMTDATLHGIDCANKLKVYDDIANVCHCSYTYTEEFLPDFGKGLGSTSENGWACGMAQLFSSVSPDVTLEFEMPYISKMARNFGGVYYGCCEKLDDRLDMVKTIPNLRKVSCSPWSDKRTFAEKIGQSIVMSAKPNPAFLSGSAFDSESAKQELLHTCRCAKENNVNLELILKDISTVGFQPDRVKQWADIAMEVVTNL